jgi:ribosome-binding factor A
MTLHSRTRRVAEEIKEALAHIIQFEVKDPRLSTVMVTVSAVEVTKDLQLARIFVSVLGDDGQAGDVMDALDHCKGFIKSQVARRVKLRFMPEMEYKLDQSAVHAARIQEMLREIELKEAKAHPPEETP